MLNSKVSCVRYFISRLMKTYNYINRVVLTLPLSVYEGTWTHSPLSLLCITMILHVRRNFFEITMLPNNQAPTSTFPPSSQEPPGPHRHHHHAAVTSAETPGGHSRP